MVIWLMVADEPVLPADPESPAGMEHRIALHGGYRGLIDGLCALLVEHCRTVAEAMDPALDHCPKAVTGR